VGWRIGLVPLLVAAVVVVVNPPTASAASPGPIDLNGSYTLTANPDCWGFEGGTLTISGWEGWTSGNDSGVAQFSVVLTDPQNVTFPGSGGETGTAVTINLTGLEFRYFTASTDGSTVTLSDPTVGCTGVNTSPESLTSLATISGTLTKADGVTPFGGQVDLVGLGYSTVADDGTYEFWLRPPPPPMSYNVSAVQPPAGLPQFGVSRCDGHKIASDTCAVELLPANPPDHNIVNFSLQSGISGTVTDIDGSVMSGIPLTLTGTDAVNGKPVDLQTDSGADGSYSFPVDPGQYTVTAGPDPAGGRFLVLKCTGTGGNQACAMTVTASQPGVADFRRSDLIVNSTQLGTDSTQAGLGVCDITPGAGTQTCTLPQAILVSNQLGGKPIGFDIPYPGGGTFDGSVPQIQDTAGNGMPSITAPAVIDGSSDPAGKVELSGTGGDTTLYKTGPKPTVGLVLASATTVRGMVINGYSDDLAATGDGGTIQDDWFGTNPSGATAKPNPLGTNTTHTKVLAAIGVLITGSGNLIGGPSQGNVFAVHRTLDPGRQLRLSGAIYDTAGGNTIQGNSIGVVADTRNPLVDPNTFNGSFAPALVATDDTVGGSASGDRNTIAPGANVSGASVVQGNLVLGELATNGDVQVGGSTATPGTGAGNEFAAIPWSNDTRMLEVTGGAVQGNTFSSSGDSAIVGGAATIGGNQPDLGNLITHVATDPAGAEGFPEFDGAIVINGSHSLVENNTIKNSGGRAAVEVAAGDATTITRNTMAGNTTQGITLGPDYIANGVNSPRVGLPNDGQVYPEIRSADRRAGGIDITGLYDEPSSGPFRLVHTVTVDLYGVSACREGPPPDETFLGSQNLTVVLNENDFGLSFNPLPSTGTYRGVTATATSPDGTSEYSPCFAIASQPASLTQAGVTPSSSSVAVTTATGGATQLPFTRAAQTKTGHGTLYLKCPVSAVKKCAGTYTLNLAGTNGRTITSGRFRIVPGYVQPIKLTITGPLLTKLRNNHRLSAVITTHAHDAAKHPHRATKRSRLTLVYE
jgi:hypothetical protein